MPMNELNIPTLHIDGSSMSSISSDISIISKTGIQTNGSPNQNFLDISTNMVRKKNPSTSESKVLVLYTGGTIGMKCKENGVYEPETDYLPFTIRDTPYLNDKEYVNEFYRNSQSQPCCLPPVRNTMKRIVYSFMEYNPLLDSSDMTFDDWIKIAEDIRKNYDSYDGFVVLQGTDTLAYSASALSFMMENLGKPVVITGAQISVAEVRSDGRENLVGALILAGNFDIPEVTVYFNYNLMRGNRCTKLDNYGFGAFISPNMDPLATMA
ncbi:hypothetical protein FO519_010392, partial [Halicephalobus sp. NKZ332]